MADGDEKKAMVKYIKHRSHDLINDHFEYKTRIVKAALSDRNKKRKLDLVKRLKEETVKKISRRG